MAGSHGPPAIRPLPERSNVSCYIATRWQRVVVRRLACVESLFPALPVTGLVHVTASLSLPSLALFSSTEVGSCGVLRPRELSHRPAERLGSTKSSWVFSPWEVVQVTGLVLKQSEPHTGVGNRGGGQALLAACWWWASCCGIGRDVGALSQPPLRSLAVEGPGVTTCHF